MMQHPAWIVIVIGLLFTGIGLAWLFAPAIPWLGRLPGDIMIDRESFKFYFPLTTCLLCSLVFSGILWVIRYFLR